MLTVLFMFLFFFYFFPSFTVDPSVTKKSFNFAKKHNMPFYFVSASDGTNVVKVKCEDKSFLFRYLFCGKGQQNNVMKH